MTSAENLMAALSTDRPIFHSEADYQHAFAWILQRYHPEASVRLELPVRGPNGAIHIDVFAKLPSGSTAIELKYKTRKLAVTVRDDDFDLADQSAQDYGRYDFIRDVCRLERLTLAKPTISGCVILLTNDAKYWTQGRDSSPIDAAFRLHAGCRLTGTFVWNARASARTVRTRERPLTLRGTYDITWHDYSQLNVPRCGVFKFLVVEVPAGSAG